MAMIGLALGMFPPLGPEPPPGFTSPPFDCPEGSDFDKSQEVGMCVGGEYDPIYSQATPGGVRTYYNLDGSAAGMDKPPAVRKTLIPGISDTYVYVGVGVLGLMLLMGRRR